MHISSCVAKISEKCETSKFRPHSFLALKTEALVLDTLLDLKPDRFKPENKAQDIYSIRKFAASQSRCGFYISDKIAVLLPGIEGRIPR